MDIRITKRSLSTYALQVGVLISLFDQKLRNCVNENHARSFFLRATVLALLCLIGASHQAYGAEPPSYECSFPVGQNGFRTCSGSGINGAIVDADVSGGSITALRSDPGNAIVPVDVAGKCRYIDNASSPAQSFFVPFRTSTEWSSVVGAPATGFTRTHCSRPFTNSLVYQVSPPNYGGCTLVSEVNTPQIYVRYPGGTNQTSGASFSCSLGTTTVAGGELWGGADSDRSYGASWTPLQTIYGPNLALYANSQLGSISSDVGTPVTVSWVAFGGNGRGNGSISCTPTSWNGGNSNNTGSVSITPTTTGPANYSITCTDTTYNLSSSAIVTINGTPAVAATISAAPSTIASGNSSLVTWTSSNATSCAINGTPVALSGSANVSPLVTSIYALTCSNSGGSATQSATITVDPDVVVNITATPSTIVSGNATALNWTSTNATSCTLNGGAVALNGGASVSPVVTTTYTLTCSNAGGSASQSTIVTVDQTVLASINAAPSTIASGASATLTWTSTNATTCTINGVDDGLNGSISVMPVVTTTYTLSCSNTGSTASQSTTVTVNPGVVVNISATPSTIISGSAASLTWTSSNATSCVLNGGGVGLNGGLNVSPTSTTTYTLTCSNAGGSASQSTIVTVDAPVTDSINANPALIASGQSSTLTWNSANAVSCTLNGASVATSGSLSVSPTSTTTYTLTCMDISRGTTSSQATVTVYSGIWTAGSCSATCGGGTIGAPTCSGGNGLCDPAATPTSGQSCNTQACLVGTCSVRTQNNIHGHGSGWVTEQVLNIGQSYSMRDPAHTVCDSFTGAASSCSRVGNGPTTWTCN